MRLIAGSASSDEARRRVSELSGLTPNQRAEAARRLTEAAFARVKGVLAAVDHHDPAATPERIAAAFDRAAAISPEGGVALYSLGDPALLASITAEVAAWIDGLGLLGPDRRLLEVGCGIGRFLAALAPRLEFAIGVDVSAGMVGEAARRCAGTANVLAVRTCGRDLACIAQASVDLVLFADSFPYLVQVGQGLAERHFAESGRVLRPGGRVLILNYSYRGDAVADANEARALARAHGLKAIAFSPPRFEGWDAAAYLFGR